MHTLIGDHLGAPSVDAVRLLDVEKACTGNAGSVVLFDNNGVHRGGFVRGGSRRILQCVFEGAE